MPSPDLFLIFTEPLERTGVRYVVTGSVASIVYGEPRVTLDIDVLVEIDVADAASFLSAFSADEFYVPPLETVLEEARRPERGHFSLVHHQTGFKADVYLPGRDSFQHWALEHPRRVEFRTRSLRVAPAEYVIVKKLEYYTEGGSDKHLRDIRAILALSGEIIDRATVENNLRSPKVRELWESLWGGR